MSGYYHTRVTTMTAALRALADRLDAAGDTTIAPVALDVTFQVAPCDSTEATTTDRQRIATVDGLCYLLGTTGTYKRCGHYGSPYGLTHRAPDALEAPVVHVGVFGEMPAPQRIIDAAHEQALAMTCDTPGCTNLPDQRGWFCSPCVRVRSVPSPCDRYAGQRARRMA